MKNFPLLLFLVLFFTFVTSGQTNQSSSCPDIRTSGGDEYKKPGETSVFTVKVENYDLNKLSYRWVTSSGEILEGQGTSSIKVLKTEDESLVATVEIDGLPGECSATFSESERTYCPPHVRLIDEFSIPVSQIARARLDDFVKDIQGFPNAKGFIIEYFKPNTSQRIINQKIQKIADYLVNEKKLERDRFKVIANLENEKNITRFWLVPPGAYDPPQDLD